MNNLEKYLYYDKPVPYKNLLIYPVLMSDYLDFHIYASCLLLDKNSVPEAISMSYFRYLFYLAEQKEPYLYMFMELLYMVLKTNSEETEITVFLDLTEKNAFFSINGITYDSNDFENIKNIIVEQNCLELIDDKIQKEVRDAMLEAEKYKMQQNTNKICSLEEQMICVLISTSLKLEDIYNLTIRKFSKILQRVDYKLHYQIYLGAQMSGFVKFEGKNTIQHWMNDLTQKDRFSNVKVNMEDVKKKIDIS
jgi:hypothetical protein